ncbi:MAG: nicotinate (nicotinamide) nucleotide adenylyltransferase [Alphaproteobacteria bacterium]|nr:nicotinate (nicotinamide) nucleotide adenylyltransferase [Alphaproteobacteria bacterium]
MSLHPLPHLLDSRRWKDRRIGLLGGSFNPPHEGHVHISIAALRGLKLDCVWWLVTPQNPIKDIAPLPLDQRLAMCRALLDHPRILVSDLESDLGTTITYDTIRRLKRRFNGTQFVWISGMDNALNLHRWHHWRDLLAEISMVHVTRPPAKSLVRGCPLRQYTAQTHRVIDQAGAYPLSPGITYWMLQKKMVNISSTALREAMKTKGFPQVF